MVLTVELTRCAGDVHCELGDLRLVNGSNRTEGRLDIYRNDRWGSVCYQDTDKSQPCFSSISACVACYQLGFAGAQEPFLNNHFGVGPKEQHTWLKLVDCRGNEAKLWQCGVWCTNTISCHYCNKDHYDVGIRCEGEYDASCNTHY